MMMLPGFAGFFNRARGYDVHTTSGDDPVTLWYAPSNAYELLVFAVARGGNGIEGYPAGGGCMCYGYFPCEPGETFNIGVRSNVPNGYSFFERGGASGTTLLSASGGVDSSGTTNGIPGLTTMSVGPFKYGGGAYGYYNKPLNGGPAGGPQVKTYTTVDGRNGAGVSFASNRLYGVASTASFGYGGGGGENATYRKGGDGAVAIYWSNRRLGESSGTSVYIKG